MREIQRRPLPAIDAVPSVVLFAATALAWKLTLILCAVGAALYLLLRWLL